MVAAHDVGRAINPTLVEGQVQGGIAQGIGMALMEAYEPGHTDNLHDYLIPTVGDAPEIEVLLVEDHEPSGPFGAKGVGEPALVPTAPAILGAIRHATGARVRSVPATPARVLAAIREATRGSLGTFAARQVRQLDPLAGLDVDEHRRRGCDDRVRRGVRERPRQEHPARAPAAAGRTGWG